MSTVIIDIDGVLANFLLAFYQEAYNIDPTVDVSLAGTSKFWHDTPSISKETVKATWALIGMSPGWWMQLKPLVSKETFKRINDLSYFHTVYFVTSRVTAGLTPVQFQTQCWLHEQGIHNACVITSGKKGEVAKAVGADFAIDDKWENAQCVHWFTDGVTKSYLLNCSYNQVEGIGSRSIIQINTVEEYLDAITKC